MTSALRSNFFLVSFFLFPFSILPAQQPAKPNAADLHQAIKKLNVLGSVLYVAAHPDDENQRLISYCANEKLYDVTYLSLTRGDGGQNLIGPELRELLGVLRTEELLMARSVDGGRQRFTRANDFGFSKNPEETLRIWNKDEVMSDVVWAIRQAQPDVIINRFYHDKKYDTHGHHTASAMLSVDAFDLAGRADAYPEQLLHTSPWKTKRQFFNTSWWFFGGREAFDKMDKSHLYPLDLGVYLPLKGKSNNEVAAEARSMHRCQGFGAMSARGESLDWFDFIKGDKPTDKNLFSGINTTWTRIPGGDRIGKLLAKVDKTYRSDNPAASVPELVKAMQMIKALPDGRWKTQKLADIKTVIQGCLGIYLEATAVQASVSPGEAVKLRLECISRSKHPVKLTGLSIMTGLFDTMPAVQLTPNQGWVVEKSVRIPENMYFTGPYWLQGVNSPGMYQVENQLLRGLPETPRYARVRWSFSVDGQPLEYDSEIAFKKEESAIGEIWQPFEILPPAFVEFTEPSYLVTGGRRAVTLRVKAGRDNVRGKVHLMSPAGWPNAIASDEARAFDLKRKGEEKEYTFDLQASGGPEQTQLQAGVEVDGKIYTLRLVTIKYDHIPQQSVLQPATVPAARVQLEIGARQIGYYMGAGDDVPTALRQMGATVTLLEDQNMTAENLRRFDAIVLGIRAYNTKENLKFHQPRLLDYVREGGTLIVQYNTNFDLVIDQLAPLPLKLSRTRVTDETSEVRLRLPDHPVLNSPNKLSAADFSGWAQERGLYFPSEWDPAFEAPLSMNDPDEKPADGSLLVTKYGNGYFVYTGLSFFRELPAGVPGAYRLFANMVSLGKEAR